MQRRELGESYRNTVLCIDSYEGRVPAGRFYNPYFKGSRAFHGLIQFLTELEQTLDAMAFPQSFTASRTFTRMPGQPAPWNPEVHVAQGELATFSIRILFRQNASWQGSVTWLEGNMEQSFRSALEFIFLVDSVLNDMNEEEVG